MNNEQRSPMMHFVRTFLITIAIIVVFAYGFEVTQINLEEPKQEKRQQQLTNVIRALARPDLTEYDTERLEIEAPLLIPCPETQVTLPDMAQPDGPAIELSTQCAAPGSEVEVTGTGFEPGDEIFLFFVPYKEDVSDQVELRVTDRVVEANPQGEFSHTIELRTGRTSDEPQLIRAVVNRRSGLPRPSVAVHDTIEKIIETIFLALIATTLGTMLAIPISFLAARNLMIQVTTLFGALVTLIAVAPLGWALGWWLFDVVGGWGVGLIVGGDVPEAAALWGTALLLLGVQAMRGQSDRAGALPMLRSYGLGLLVTLGLVLVLGLISGVGQMLGTSLLDPLGPFDFLANFVYVLSDALAVFLPLVGGIAGMFTLISISGTLSRNLLRRSSSALLNRGYTVLMAAAAGAVLLGLPARFIAWLYQLPDLTTAVGMPALIGAVLLGLMALLVDVERPMATGLIVYYVSRTVLNVLRAIEPLIMAIVFVVWVGIGPFAGVLALTLHTIAALGKLYSEQVENISSGPIEAVTATGANKLQTIIYAVIPQIVPPYIAFTIYRWDINVRMSTIIGFAGGGGIGFLLQQNLNLLKYRQAAVQMIAIAIVVASLDYVSARIRERII